MYKYYILTFFFVSLVFENCFSQRDSLAITISPYFGQYTYQKNGVNVPSNEFYASLQKEYRLHEKFKNGKATSTVGTIVANIGAFLIGWNIGELMVSKKEDKKYNLGIIGAGALAIGLPLSWGGRRQSQKALDEFNMKVQNYLPENNVKLNYVPGNPKIKTSYGNKFDSSCLFVRVPVYGKKINLLKGKLENPDISEKSRLAYQKELDETLRENKAYFDIISDAFKLHFTFKEVFFVPDSSFKSLLDGKTTGFINHTGVLDPSLQCKADNNFYFITGKDKDQLLFVDEFLQKPSKPFPHRKNTFMPAFKKIFDRRNYIHKQVIYFNDKLYNL